MKHSDYFVENQLGQAFLAQFTGHLFATGYTKLGGEQTHENDSTGCQANFIFQL
jgi:hypothetical protein